MARIAATKPPAVDESAAEVSVEAALAPTAPTTDAEATVETVPVEATDDGEAVAAVVAAAIPLSAVPKPKEGSLSLGPKETAQTKQSKIAAAEKTAKMVTKVKEDLPKVTLAQAIAPALPKMDETGFAPGLNTTAAPIESMKPDDSKGREKRKAHSEVERRRRDKINSKITALQDCVPEYISTKNGSSKSNKNHKANILENTIHYINDLETALYKFDPSVRLKIHESAARVSEAMVDAPVPMAAPVPTVAPPVEIAAPTTEAASEPVPN